MPIEMPSSSLEKILDGGHIRNIITTETQYSKFGKLFSSVLGLSSSFLMIILEVFTKEI
jgi:hypothetical protein